MPRKSGASAPLAQDAVSEAQESVAVAEPASEETIIADPEIAAEAALQAEIAAAKALLEANGLIVRERTQSAPRETKPKADPAEVKAYFQSTGLTTKELCAVVGVGSGVILTVQNPNGDRWSQEIFDARKVVIDAYLAEKAAAQAAADAAANVVIVVENPGEGDAVAQ